MARTVRREVRDNNPRTYHPSKRARRGEVRTTRQDTRRTLREFVR